LSDQIKKELDEIKKIQKEEADFEKALSKISSKPAQLPTGEELSDCSPEQLANALALRSLAAELLDYKGQYTAANEFVDKPGEHCMTALKKVIDSGRLPHGSRELMKQQIWVVLQAGLCKYRAGSYDDALGMFNICNSVLLKDLATSIGTRARCLYSIALIHRERYELKPALEKFTEATELAYKSLDRLRGGHSQLALVAVARTIGMGLASVHNTLGRPDIAIPLLLSAKAMLPRGERVISTHLDLIRATLIPWAYAGADKSSRMGEDERVNELGQCRVMFEQLGHAPYKARASHRLAEALLRRCKITPGRSLTRPQEDALARVEQTINEFKSLVPGDTRFMQYAYCLNSEIARLKGHFERAEGLASTGLEIGSGQYPGVELALRMARAEAQIHKGEAETAVADLQRGLEIAKSAHNHHQHALFLLKLSEAYAKSGLEKDAFHCIKEFEDMEHFVEVKAPDVEALKQRIDELTGRDGGTLVFSLKQDLTREEAEKKLRQFLVRWARYRQKTDSAAAEELGIGRSTFYTWEKE
jgi:tetratricopeptide (TPR) repeat protein